jgi:hypothetical protein
MVTWDQITAECDGYRAGFVAVFRKYEGEPTDEKDGQGRTIKVTAASFARHNGIGERSFQRWVKEAGATASSRQGPARTGQMARQAVKSEKVPVQDKVGMLEDLTSDPKVLRAWREQRAPKVTPEHVKHVEAVVDAFTAPLAQAAGRLQVPMWADRIKDIAKGLGELELEPDDLRALDAAVKRLSDELEVQRFRLGLEV